ncbi:S41 family peptidase [Christiangramia sabulilitoris]|nr:S41 family peptidase [Christiangramia sabulilitoris]
MKLRNFLPIAMLAMALFVSCSDDDIAEPETTELPGEVPDSNVQLEIKDFLWKAMNNIYLYKEDVPFLADDYFATQTELNNWLANWDSPEELFYEGLAYNYPNVDRFSWVVSDYEVLESQFQGTGKSAGFTYGWSYAPNSTTEVIAYILYVAPGGPADVAGLKRGDFISEVNGETITINNYNKGILSPDFLEVGLSTIENGALVPQEGTLEITKTSFKEDTSPISKVFIVDGVRVGYLYLSSFLGEFGVDDVKLNDAFGFFDSENIDELIVDLRYNRGGYSEFSADLGSMVTGQFEGEIFTKQQWNAQYQAYFEQEDPERLLNKFDGAVSNGDAINGLNLNRVYVLGTGRSFSASESFIIGLEPYIDVVHVGTETGGKFQGSVTLYDGDGFGKQNINTNHKYAVQPLVYKFANANGFTDFVDGLVPDIVKEEDILNLGQLGELDEPLLARAVADITGSADRSFLSEGPKLQKIKVEEERGFFIETPLTGKELPIKKRLFEEK